MQISSRTPIFARIKTHSMQTEKTSARNSILAFLGQYNKIVIWLLISGWELALAHIVCGLIYCVTIIGIPFGKQCFKLAKLALFPFGATIRE